MKINSFRGPNKGDVQGIDDNLNRVLDILNKPLEEHTEALQGNLNADNFNQEVRDIQVFHNIEVRISLQKIKGKCIGALPLWNSLYDYVKVAFQQISETQVKIKCYFDTTPTGKVNVRLLLIGE